MTQTPAEEFADLMHERLNPGSTTATVEPATPPVPRAPRPDPSQGSSSNPTYLDRHGMSVQLFERAIHASLNRPLWEELR